MYSFLTKITGERLKQTWTFSLKYVCSALLYLKPLTFCAKCDKELLEENVIDLLEQNDLSRIQCDISCAWFLYKCENIKSRVINDTNNE